MCLFLPSLADDMLFFTHILYPSSVFEISTSSKLFVSFPKLVFKKCFASVI
jgi:hypothetical protein